MPTLTRAIFSKGLSSKGLLRPAQFRALGYSGPFKGWKNNLVGKQFSSGQLDEFIRLRKPRHRKGAKEDGAKVRDLKTERSKQKHRERQKNIYRRDLNDDRWKEKRNFIIERDGYRCVMCGEKRGAGIILNVHHLLYDKDLDMWDVPDFYLVTLCTRCHKKEHSRKLAPPKKHF
jgi:5-methylcytosine-specific restriction endonuclease McrA